jgi:hypothetical protein
MLKKSVLNFFNYDLAECDQAKSLKFFDFSTTCGGADYENFLPFENKESEQEPGLLSHRA